jgi:hypothetical protein
MTKEEREALAKLGEVEGSESNAIRRALRLLMLERNLPIPEGLFADREPGNRLPKPKGKEDRQEAINLLAVNSAA